MKGRIMYVELKTGYHDDGPAWIGRVRFSKTGQTVYYRGLSLRRIPGGAAFANHRDVETGDEYWLSGSRSIAKIATGPGGVPSRSTTTRGRRANDFVAKRG